MTQAVLAIPCIIPGDYAVIINKKDWITGIIAHETVCKIMEYEVVYPMIIVKGQ